MASLPLRNLLEAVDKRHGFGARMRLHVAHHHVVAFRQHLMRLHEHGIRFADARRIAEEYLELAARIALDRLGFLDLPQDGVGVASRVAVVRLSHRFPFLSAYRIPSSMRFTFSTFTRAWPSTPN